MVGQKVVQNRRSRPVHRKDTPLSPQTFGEWLKQRRQALDLTQEALAERVGCAVETIRKIERGARRPSKDMSDRIALVLDVPEEDRSAFVQSARGTVPTKVAVMPPRPRWKPPASVKGLPAPSGPLLGREKELPLLKELALRPEVRLITLTGPGGTGKTRLALAVAQDLATAFSDGVVFVGLASLTDPSLVPSVISQALGLQENTSEGMEQQPQEILASKDMLLVLDNFEQVVTAATLLPELLLAAPQLKLLVTSRESLHLSMERELYVPPFEVMVKGKKDGVELAGLPAVQLFALHATAAKPDFRVTSTNAGTIAAICAQVDGLPLAIQLAATHLKFFPLGDLLDRLKDRLFSAVAGPRDFPERQQSLRAAIDWSYELLDTSERRVFAAMGVFLGGCSITAAEAVLNNRGSLAYPVMLRLTSLTSKSLITATEAADGTPRFGMLETIREYAMEQLGRMGDLRQFQLSHLQYFITLAESAEPYLQQEGRHLWQVRLQQEADNFRAALQWALDEREAGGLQLASALGTFWIVSGQFSEARYWLERTLAAIASASSTVQAKALAALGNIAVRQGDYVRVKSCTEERIRLCRELGDRAGEAESLRVLGDMAAADEEFGDAQELYFESLSMFRELGHTAGIAHVMNNLGELARYREDMAAARGYYAESLRLSEEAGDQSSAARALFNLGWVAFHESGVADAARLFQASLAIQQRLGGSPHRIVFCVMALAAVAAAQGEIHRAALLFGAAEVLRQSIGISLDPADRIEYDRHLRLVRQQLPGDEFQNAWNEGSRLSLQEAAAIACQGE